MKRQFAENTLPLGGEWGLKKGGVIAESVKPSEGDWNFEPDCGVHSGFEDTRSMSCLDS